MDLRKYLAKLEELREVEVLEGADRDLEIGAMTEISSEREGQLSFSTRSKVTPQGTEC